MIYRKLFKVSGYSNSGEYLHKFIWSTSKRDAIRIFELNSNDKFHSVIHANLICDEKEIISI